MDDNSDVNSDGSDIEIDDIEENDTLKDDFELEQVNRNADEWLEALFDSNSENEDEFEGFQEEWVRDRFAPRVKPRFRLIGGATFQLPKEAEAFHYFELLWDDEMWRQLVTETNRYAEQERRKNPPSQSRQDGRQWMLTR